MEEGLRVDSMTDEERKIRNRINQKNYRARNPDKVAQRKQYSQLHRYKLGIPAYEAMLKKQKNGCAVCLVVFKDTPHIDHCHSTGKIRGLLCDKCNKGLGFFEDDKNKLKRAIKYLSI